MRTVVTEKTKRDLWEPNTLPEPSSCFTIPSILDDTFLECRIYHAKQAKGSKIRLETKAAIIAHPYTPMGGCFDDHVLHTAGAEFLKQGYILGLFNFRGAGASKGHSSWSSKPEQDDYISFVGLMLYYLDELHRHDVKSPSPVSSLTPVITQVESPSAEIQATRLQVTTDQGKKQHLLVLGGYSYGSFIARQLPDIKSILRRFDRPEVGTAAAEIQLRGAHLAQDHIEKLQATKQRGRTLTVEPLGSPVYGGEESQPGTRRVSRESRRSIDAVRRIIEKPRTHLLRRKHSSSDGHETDNETLDLRTIPIPEIRYLLISPLLPPVSAFLALGGRWWKSEHTADNRLKSHRAIAIWGNNDFFTSGKRLIKWAHEIQETSTTSFDYFEVENAGHFWLEEGAEDNLRHAIREWITASDAARGDCAANSHIP